MLVDEVVRADQDAFAELFELVAPVVTARLHTWPAGSVDPASVRAIIAGTFVEVWWLAPSHNGPDTDVLRWISGIAARRALDRLGTFRPGTGPAPTPADPVAAAHDQRAEMTLSNLLRRPRGGSL